MNHLPPRARRRPSRRLACLAALAVGAASFGGGGGQTAATSPGATTSDVLRIVNAYSIANLDPAQPGTVWMWDFGAAESTLAVGEDGRLEPWLATSVERLDDLTWQVQLRDDVTFHNGRPMDAEAYAAAIERQIELSADAVGLAGATLAVDGPSTVTITTPAPNAHVPALLAERGAFVVYDVEAVEAAAGDADALTDAGFYTGPYAIVEWDPEHLVLVRNVDYWGEARHSAGSRRPSFPTSRHACSPCNQVKQTSRCTRRSRARRCSPAVTTRSSGPASGRCRA